MALNNMLIENIINHIMSFVMQEAAQSKDFVALLNQNNQLLMILCKVVMPVIDAARAEFPQYAVLFDLIETVYKDAQSQGLIK